VNKKYDLSDYGVIVKEKSFQWLNDKSKISFEVEK
jgi:hypothetical protein